MDADVSTAVADLDRWLQGYPASDLVVSIRVAIDALTEAQAETERLRAALRELAENPGTDGWSRHKAERALLSGGAEEAHDATA